MKAQNTLLPALLFALCTRETYAAATFTPLGDLPGGSFESIANGISADGSVIVGQGISAAGPEAFRWTREGGMVGLGDLPGGAFQSEANDVYADGSVIVGFGRSA